MDDHINTNDVNDVCTTTITDIVNPKCIHNNHKQKNKKNPTT